MRTQPWLPLLLAAALAGCAQSSKSGRLDSKAIAAINWSERIGRYSWDQATTELGRPVVIGESSAGRTAEWVLRRSPRMSFGFGVGSSSYGSSGGVGVGVGTSVSPPPSGEYLRLEFGPDSQLAKWSKIKY